MNYYNTFIEMLDNQEDIKKTEWTNKQIEQDGNFVGISNYKW